ncbi:MAG: GNAT family N-acetyltransferase [Bacteroidota bacterium]
MTGLQLHITTATMGGATDIISLGITTFRETFAHLNSKEDMDKYITTELNEEKIRGEIADDESTFFVARTGDTPIGYAKMRTGHTPPELASHNPIEIERLYVLKAYHDQKAGAALMAHCLRYAEARQFDTVWLGVWEHNARAIRFYEKWGFTLFGSHVFVLGTDHQTDVLMKKSLLA